MSPLSCWRSWGTQWEGMNQEISDLVQYYDHLKSSFQDYLLGLFLGHVFKKWSAKPCSENTSLTQTLWLLSPHVNLKLPPWVFAALTSFCFILSLSPSGGFHSLKGHHSVHYVLDASFILSWRSLFIEPKLAPRMETNGKRMCTWIHAVLFMPTDHGTEHV